MMNTEQLTELIRKAVQEVTGGIPPVSPAVDPGEVPDLSKVDLRAELAVPDPAHAEEYLNMKARTPARLGVWRAGPRYRTKTYLRFRADHAVAMDAVFTDVPEDFLAANGLFQVTTRCTSKDEFLTRPDLGRLLDPDTVAALKSKCKANPQVQVYVSDGLSSTAVEANIPDLLPALLQGLKSQHIEAGTPFYVKYGRVGAMDEVAKALGSEVTIVLLGERPGLATGESLSAYMTYRGYPGMPEAGRTVVSNIYQGGTNPAEAGAHIASIAKKMLEQKASGVDLKM